MLGHNQKVCCGFLSTKSWLMTISKESKAKHCHCLSEKTRGSKSRWRPALMPHDSVHCWVIFAHFPNVTCFLKNQLYQNIICSFPRQLPGKHPMSDLSKISSRMSTSAKPSFHETVSRKHNHMTQLSQQWNQNFPLQTSPLSFLAFLSENVTTCIAED